MLIEKIKQRFADAILDAQETRGESVITIDRERALDLMRALRDEPEFGFTMLADVTAVDWLERDPRFDVVYQLKSHAHPNRLRVKVRVPAAEAWVDSVYQIWKSADWLERECFDMFGISFKGHPDLRRILLYDSFSGHPLRKDYPYQKRQPIVEETDPIVNPLRSSR